LGGRGRLVRVVTEGGIEAGVAKAREIAGDKWVELNGGQIAK
jgi:hypothetical protein